MKANKAEKVIIGVCAVQMAAGVLLSVHLNDIRPAMLTACLAFLGAEILDHIHPRKAR